MTARRNGAFFSNQNLSDAHTAMHQTSPEIPSRIKQSAATNKCSSFRAASTESLGGHWGMSPRIVANRVTIINVTEANKALKDTVNKIVLDPEAGGLTIHWHHSDVPTEAGPFYSKHDRTFDDVSETN